MQRNVPEQLSPHDLCSPTDFAAALRSVASKVPSISRLGGVDQVVAFYSHSFWNRTCLRGEHARATLDDGRRVWLPVSVARDASSAAPLLINAGEGSTGTRFLNCVASRIGLKAAHNQYVSNASDFALSDFVSDHPVPELLAPLLAAFRGQSHVMMTLRDPWEWLEARRKHTGSDAFRIGTAGCGLGIRLDDGTDDELATHLFVYNAFSACMAARQGAEPVLINLFNEPDVEVQQRFIDWLRKGERNVSLERAKNAWAHCKQVDTSSNRTSRRKPLVAADPNLVERKPAEADERKPDVSRADGGTPKLLRSNVLISVMSSCATASRLEAFALGGACTRTDSCPTYLDGSACAEGLPKGFLAVAPEEYMPAFLSWALPSTGSTRCCDPMAAGNTVNIGPADYARSRSPSQYFCKHHRAATFNAQYRFLPALAHARAHSFLTAWQQDRGMARPDWSVFVDDDSVVQIEPLLGVLGSHDHTEPVQLGEFLGGPANLTHWSRPFACGGAGTIFSAAAMVAADFAECAAAMQRDCLQSDWAVAICAKQFGISVANRDSCQICGRTVTRGNAQTALQRLRGGCAFAQYTMSLKTFFAALPSQSWKEHATRPAIAHAQYQHDRGMLLTANLNRTAKLRGTMPGCKLRLYILNFVLGSSSNGSRGRAVQVEDRADLQIIAKLNLTTPSWLCLVFVGDAPAPSLGHSSATRLKTTFAEMTARLGGFLGAQSPASCSKRLGSCPRKLNDYKPLLPLLYHIDEPSSFVGWADMDVLLSHDILLSVLDDLDNARVSMLRIAKAPYFLSWGGLSVFAWDAYHKYVTPWLRQEENLRIIRHVVYETSKAMAFDEWGMVLQNNVSIVRSFSGLLIRLAAAEKDFVVARLLLERSSFGAQLDDIACRTAMSDTALRNAGVFVQGQRRTETPVGWAAKSCPECYPCESQGATATAQGATASAQYFLVNENASQLLLCHLHYRKREPTAASSLSLARRSNCDSARKQAAQQPPQKPVLYRIPRACFTKMALRMSAWHDEHDSVGNPASISLLDRHLRDGLGRACS